MTAEEIEPTANPFWVGVKWAGAGIVVTVGFSLLFDLVWFSWISWNWLHIPMGQAGAMYPLFFFVPVLTFSCLYQVAAYLFFIKPSFSVKRRLIFVFALPCFIVALLLILNCPIDGGGYYPEEFIKALRK